MVMTRNVLFYRQLSINTLPVLLLLSLSILELTIETLVYSIFLPLKFIVFNSSWIQLLVLSPTTRKFHHITLILEFPHWLRINERIQYKLLCLTYKALQTGHPIYLRSLLSLACNHSTRSSYSSLYVEFPSSFILKSSIGFFYHSSPALWTSLPHDVCRLSFQLVHHFSSSELIAHYSPSSELATSLFWKRSKLICSQFFCRVVCIHLGFLRTDGID